MLSGPNKNKVLWRRYIFCDVALDDTYGQCSACGDEPEPPLQGDFGAMTFDEADRVYSARGFGGADESAIAEDPTDADNTVLQISKSDAAELWAGVTVSYGPGESVHRMPFDAQNTRITARVWSPDEGTVFRIKVEDAGDAAVSVETEATTTVAGQWEVLTFDFATQAPGTAALNLEATYNKLSVFGGFGTGVCRCLLGSTLWLTGVRSFTQLAFPHLPPSP